MDFSTCKAVLEAKATNEKITMICNVLSRSLIVHDNKVYNLTPNTFLWHQKNHKSVNAFLKIAIKIFISNSFKEVLEEIKIDNKRRVALTKNSGEKELEKYIKGDNLVSYYM